MRFLYPFAKRFIAGEDRKTAIKNIRAIYQRGYLSTVDVLGENVFTEAQAGAARDEYLNLLKDVETLHFPLDLSVKLTSLGLDIDYDLCKKNVEAIVNAAGQHTVRFDMEGSDCTERTVNLCLELHAPHNNLGLVLQSYLRRTEADVDRVIQNKISTRLCKGAYQEPADIAFQSMTEVRANFLKQARRLLKEGYLPAIATHDEYLIQMLLEFIRKENILPQSFYFELLYGVRRDLQKILLDKGYRVRIYVPYGKSWLPYTLRRLGERKENIVFVVKNLIRETFGMSKIQ